MAKSVLIIGGGVIGLCTAYYALQKGHKVTILERGTSQHDCCCRGNAGMIVPSHFIPLAAPGMVTLGLRMMANPESPFYIKPRLSAGLVGWAWKFFRACNADHVNRSATLLRDLSLASRQCFDELSQITANDFGLVKKGLLMLCKTEHALAEETKTAARSNQLGIPAELLTPEKTAALEPGLKMDIAGSIYFPLDCHLTPDRFLASLTKLIRASGGDFSFETQVNGWRTSSRQIDAVTTNKGEFRADEFVIAG
ncbi:MAG TPA: FAD-dependent oxidoreductase, partial [Verrucomicrobiae bacterium]